jgi:hypothetical protein
VPIITPNGPVVSTEEAKDYGKVWRHSSGLIVPLDDAQYEFAAAFASVMLKGFMSFIAQSAAKAVEEKANEVPIKGTVSCTDQ